MPRVALVGDDLADHDPALGVDPGGGLVEEHHLGPADQGQGQGEPLLLPSRQPPPRGAAHRPEPDQVEQAVGVLGVVVVPGEQVEHLGRAEHRVDAARAAASPRSGAPGRRGRAGVEAEDRDRAAGARR